VNIELRIIFSLDGAGPDRLGGALVRRLLASLDAHEGRLRTEDRRQRIRLEWQQLALVIDR
jgi:hypothetical protein